MPFFRSHSCARHGAADAHSGVAGALSAAASVGGQAVMEGVMMRKADVYALAVRRPDGRIVVERHPWITLSCGGLPSLPFVRGFPLMLETLINGIRALDRSARICGEETGDAGGLRLLLVLPTAFALAAGLFVAAPHLLALGMARLGWSADMDGVSFHVWDGVFKFILFVGYILSISLIPEVRRVFRYHGAEHKVIRAYEAGDAITPRNARRQSRLHPRCGTTFVLFVLVLAVVLHAVLVPLLPDLHAVADPWARHAAAMGLKLLMMIPISAAAYEFIRRTARMGDGLPGALLRGPGMLLQLLTTWEPDEAQLEVAAAALCGVLEQPDPETDCSVHETF